MRGYEISRQRLASRWAIIRGAKMLAKIGGNGEFGIFGRPLSAVVSQALLGALPRNSFVNCACSAFASLKMLEHFRGLTFRQALPAPRLSERRRVQRNRFGNVDPRELFQ